MNALEYFKAKDRMTRRCCINCKDCKLSPDNNGKDISCYGFESEFPEQAIKIVEDWVEENKVKIENNTIKQTQENINNVDMVNHPNHYNYKSMECKDIINIMCEGIKEGQAYKLGCVVKYLYRYPMKNNAIQDLEKAKTYIDMIIKELEGDTNEH